jgi:hypothetical protein
MLRHVSAALFCASLLFIGCSSSPSPAGPFTVSGTVNGLSGSGLALQDNGGDTLLISRNGAFTFATPLSFGSPYAVTISAQPDLPSQRCSVSSNGGVVESQSVSNIAVTCVNTSFSVGGTVSGLTGHGLVLQDNGGDDLSVSTNGSFTFATPVATGSPYSVSVLTQPSSPAQFCTVSASGGPVVSSNVTAVVVTCGPAQVLSFASCGASGASGPTQTQCTEAYAGTPLDGEVTVTGSGLQSLTVSLTDTYLITASGAAGGTSQFEGGLGAVESGIFSLTAGTVLQVVVGQAGTGSSSRDQCAGGGGASYVVSAGTPLLIAAGGGGGDNAAGSGGQAALGACTATGGGGAVPNPGWGSGGGGFSGDGADDAPYCTGGASFTDGSLGGVAGIAPAGGATAGGFGGGGGAGYFEAGGAAGGGGGYAGGNGDPGSAGGSGGSSCNSGTSPSDSTGTGGAGNGTVTLFPQ